MTIPKHRSHEGRSRSARRDPSRGGAAVEFALVLPIFLLLVMGALDYGYFFFANQVVVGAAREGARAATMDTYANAGTVALNAAYHYMQQNGVNCSTGSSDCIHVTPSQTTLSIGGNTLTYNKVAVDIFYPFTSLTGYISSWMIPGQIRGYAEMRW